MKTTLEDLKARLIIMKDYLEREECIGNLNSPYADDLRYSIKKCQKQIKQIEYARKNPVVLNY